MAFKIGNWVRTPMGEGTVVGEEDGAYMVELEFGDEWFTADQLEHADPF